MGDLGELGKVDPAHHDQETHTAEVFESASPSRVVSLCRNLLVRNVFVSNGGEFTAMACTSPSPKEWLETGEHRTPWCSHFMQL